MQKLLVIVPTRNRANLAISAASSVLECSALNIAVMISDNSTNEHEVARLASFVSASSDARLFLRRPSQPLSMTLHWDWALGVARTQVDVTHVTVLTDRMMFKRDALEPLLRVTAAHPSDVISYNHDRVVDHKLPPRTELQPWSDRVLQLPSERILSLSSECIFPQALPRLLNCVVPAYALALLKERFGNIVSSIAPDHSFCYRILALTPTIKYWDRAPIIHYALFRSNGESVSRGVETPDHKDFLLSMPNQLYPSTPIPGIRTIGNAVLHEYCVARSESQSDKFPPINRSAYVSMISSELDLMENETLAKEMRGMLAEYEAEQPVTTGARTTPDSESWTPRRFARRLGVGPALLRASQLMSRSFGPPEPDKTFASAAEAVEYARGNNGEHVRSAKRLAYLIR